MVFQYACGFQIFKIKMKKNIAIKFAFFSLFVLFSFLVIFKKGNFFAHASAACDAYTNSDQKAVCESKNNQILAIEAQIQELQNKLGVTKKQEGDIQQNIDYLDGQIDLSKLKISESEAIIEKRSQDIDNLTNNILLLEDSLNKNTQLFLKRINLSYRQGNLDPFMVFFGSGSFSDKINKYKYLQIVQSADRQFLFKIQATKNSYNTQKKVVEQEKKDLEAQKVILEQRKQVLAGQISEKQGLLAQAQSQEKVLSAQIENLQAQRKNLLGGVSSLITSNAGCQNWTGDNNYFNQTDCRWGNVIIGNANYADDSFMWKYGCAVTSVAMVMKNMGIGTDPQQVAGNSSLFAKSGNYQTDLIMWDAVASNFGKSLNWLSSWAQVDDKLSQGKWVIVHVTIGGYGYGHYVVLIAKDGNGYKMHDPYYGNNLNFYDRYSGSDQMLEFE
jgi:peptidoglycan hydrolase CwlO-like protein